MYFLVEINKYNGKVTSSTHQNLASVKKSANFRDCDVYILKKIKTGLVVHWRKYVKKSYDFYRLPKIMSDIENDFLNKAFNNILEVTF